MIQMVHRYRDRSKQELSRASRLLVTATEAFANTNKGGRTFVFYGTFKRAIVPERWTCDGLARAKGPLDIMEQNQNRTHYSIKFLLRSDSTL